MRMKLLKAPEGMRPIRIQQTPLVLLILIACTVFISEACIMLLLSVLPHYAPFVQALIDALLLLLLMTPPLYFFMLRPMRGRIDELVHASNQLRSEITERELTEVALRKSEKQLRFLSSQLLSKQEREKRWLSRELHEELAQELVALKLHFRSIARNLGKDEGLLQEKFEQNLKLIDQVIDNVYRLSEDLTPFVLQDFGLCAALQKMIDRVGRDSGMATSFQPLDIDNLFPREVQIAVYRVIEEAVRNAVKHARATRLWVVVERQKGYVSFAVEDNGTGFDIKSTLMKNGSERGLGLTTMEEWVRMLGGSFSVWSEIEQGTRITFTVPEKQE